MCTREDIEAYLNRSGHPHREVAPDTWIVSDPGGARENIVMRITDGMVLFRLKVMELSDVDAKRREKFFETLLRLNTEDMVNSAYGVSDDAVILTATLRLEQLDFNEFSGTLDDFSLAVTNHYGRLSEFRTAA